MKFFSLAMAVFVCLALKAQAQPALECNQVINFDKGYSVKVVSDAYRNMVAMVYKKNSGSSGPLIVLNCSTASGSASSSSSLAPAGNNSTAAAPATTAPNGAPTTNVTAAPVTGANTAASSATSNDLDFTPTNQAQGNSPSANGASANGMPANNGAGSLNAGSAAATTLTSPGAASGTSATAPVVAAVNTVPLNPPRSTPGSRGQNDQVVYSCKNPSGTPALEVNVILAGLALNVDLLNNGAMETQLSCKTED